ncbi:hypothetical protein BJY17_003293 [Agromyces hippuratus]|uniref:Uncharacterized protein n=1 Tax=Agromyces hippuratus TaxID=286438 RepID=A0A852WWR0_9MICO|nr:hypothetical protein [Agromyces hippuratus]NYG22546.1 hypothetical protein [Agromyces hippuratus]
MRTPCILSGSPESSPRPRPRIWGGVPLAPPTPQPSTTEQQLADLDREIEYYQRRAELERLKRDADGDAAR